MRPNVFRSIASTVALAALLGGLGVAPAQAGILGSGSEPVNDSFEFSECGFDIRLEVEGLDAYVDKLRGGDTASFDYLGAWYTRATSAVTETYTNLDTGRSFRREIRSASWDQKILAESGNVFTYRRAGNFTGTVFTQEGRRVYSEVGRFVYDYLYDTQGTTNPDDDTDTVIDGTFRYDGNGKGDFCRDVETLTA